METKRIGNTVEVTLSPDDILDIVWDHVIDFAEGEFSSYEYMEDCRCSTDEEKPFVVKVTARVSVDLDMKRRCNG